MENFSFNKKSKILIYGYGKTGKDLHCRLTEQGYHIAGIIDKNAEQIANEVKCLAIKPEELDIRFTDHIIIITLQNILEHERVVKMLSARGAKNIVYLNGSDPEKYQACFRKYDQLIHGAAINDFDFPLASVGNEPERGYYFQEEAGFIIAEIPSQLLFNSRPLLGINNDSFVNIASFKKYNALYNIVLHGKYDFENFNFYCSFSDFEYESKSHRTMETYLRDRFLLYQLMQDRYMKHGISFFRNTPSPALWNRQQGYFNLTDGHHRASFLVNSHIHLIPVRISKKDYDLWYNCYDTEKCRKFIKEQHIANTYTPILHPAFTDINYSAEKGGSLTATALYKFFEYKAVTGMNILDLNSNISYFSQIFNRMNAANIVSLEPRKDLFGLAKLLNQLHYADNIEMHNNDVDEFQAQSNYDVVIMANDLSLDYYIGKAGRQVLEKIDSLASNFFIHRSGTVHDGSKNFILKNSSFTSYNRLNVEIIDGKLSEVGVYEK